MDLYLGGGGQEDVLRRFLICSQRVSLTSVDEVKGHGLLLLDERFLLSMRLEETNTAVNRGDGEHTWSCRASRHWPPKWQACQTDVNLIFLCFYPKSHLGNIFSQHLYLIWGGWTSQIICIMTVCQLIWGGSAAHLWCSKQHTWKSENSSSTKCRQYWSGNSWFNELQEQEPKN